jgi:hypothetical protein
MSQPAKSRVFFLVLCLAFFLAILGTMDLHAATGTELRTHHRVSREATSSVSSVDPAVARLQALARGDARVHLDDSTGLATFVGLGPAATVLKVDGRTAEEQAVAFLRDYGLAFGIADVDAELELAEVGVTDSGTKLRFIQLHRGLRVVGGELRVYFGADGRLSAVDSGFKAGLDVET